MTEEIRLPTYETLLTEAIRSLAVDSGTVTSRVSTGGNVLQDDTKNWPDDVHKNRLVKIIRGSGAGQTAVIEGNSTKSLVIKGSWRIGLNTTSVYVILERIDYGGEVYENIDTAVNDLPRRFEVRSKKLNDVVIYVETNDQVFGNQTTQRFPVAAGGTLGFTKVDISTLWFKNRNAGQNGTVYILGIEQ